MSDVTTGSVFNPNFFMSPPWWIGRVEEKETWSDNIAGETFTSAAQIKGWGHRYKVRVFNWHSGEMDKLPPKDMAFCQVVMPVTAGSGHGGGGQTPSIEAGSVVFGFFLDGMAGQDGYIIGTLGNSNNNVPKKRGEPPTNAPRSSSSRNSTGTTVTRTLPPPTVSGPGSAANQPVPSNVNQLSTNQLVRLLDPSKTPSSEAFRAASEAREKYRASQKAKGLPINKKEEERQALIATVVASRKPGSSAGSNANCNLGYQQFNDTYTDGNQMRSAKVPDNAIVGNAPLSIPEAPHIETSADTSQNKDSKRKIPLLDVCKDNKSETKGIQRVMQNLLNDIEDLKKQFNQVSAFATKSQAYANEVQTKVLAAIEEISGYLKNTLTGVRGYILTELDKRVKEVAQDLFPSEKISLYEKVEEGTSLINCLFNRLISGLKGLLARLLSNILDNYINAPLCAIEKFLSNFIDSILGPIVATIESIFATFSSLFGKVTSALGSFSNILDVVTGIIEFFSCDQEPDCVEYTEISQDGPATPTFDLDLGLPAFEGQASECPTGPVACGPPTIKIFGGGGVNALINPIISPISSSIIAFDIVNSGSGFKKRPKVAIVDRCGKGSGASAKVNLKPLISKQTFFYRENQVAGAVIGRVTATDIDDVPGNVTKFRFAENKSKTSFDGFYKIDNSGTITITSAGVATGVPNNDFEISPNSFSYKVQAGDDTDKWSKPAVITLKLIDVDDIVGIGTTAAGVGIGTTNLCDQNALIYSAKLQEELETEKTIDDLTILSPGDGYLSSPDGSLGGGERVWKEADEGYVKTKCDTYYVVQPGKPIEAEEGDTYYPPTGDPTPIEEDQEITLPLVPVTPPESETYPVVLCIKRIEVLDSGFGYRPGDQLIITPSNGTETELVINEFGNIESIKVIRGGCGFLDFPEIRTNSPTGFNATFTPVFSVTRLEDFSTDIGEDIPFISVVDCVGKIPPTQVFNIPR
jgi:hypothetical protein